MVWAFWGASALAVAGALATILARGPIRSALALLVTILGLAALFVLLDAHLLAAIQVIVYAGAVVVLFVFVIMVLGPAAEPSGPGGRALVARGLSVIALGWIGWRIVRALWAAERAADVPDGFGTTVAVADSIFGPFLVPFELVSILLLVAVVGAIALARAKHAAGGPS